MTNENSVYTYDTSQDSQKTVNHKYRSVTVSKKAQGRSWGIAREVNFKITDEETGLVMHRWKGLFKTLNLIQIVLANDYY